jgi:hypothetical protein
MPRLEEFDGYGWHSDEPPWEFGGHKTHLARVRPHGRSAPVG